MNSSRRAVKQFSSDWHVDSFCLGILISIKVIQDMYVGCTTSVRTLIGSTESFEVKVGLHQGSALSPLLFITVMDVISK